MPLLSTRIFSDFPFTLFVASATVKLPVDPLGAAVGACVGGVVAADEPPFELLEHAARASAASTAAAATILTFVERIGTLSRFVFPASTTDVVSNRFNAEP